MIQLSCRRNFAFIVSIAVFILNCNPILSYNNYADTIAEITMNTVNLVSMNNYPIEKHTIKTKDGYNLITHRISHGKSKRKSTAAGIPILLMHSLFCNSVSWIDNLEDSLGFILANKHFDVWLGNIRGNEGTWHGTYKRNEAKFWDYSWEDMAEYDVSAIIDYIREETGYNKILYIGYSIGSLIGFALLSEKPEFNDKVAGFVAFGPILTPHYVTGIAMKKIADNFRIIQTVSSQFESSEFKIIPKSMKKYATIVTFFKNTMANYFFTNFGGYGRSFYNKDRFSIYVRDCMESTSTKNLIHLNQLYTHTMAKFDYGKQLNIDKYHTVTPPEYNTSNIVVSVALFSAANDPISTPIDVQLTARKLPTVIASEIVPEPMFNHANFMWTNNSKHLLYNKVIEILQEMWKLNGLL